MVEAVKDTALSLNLMDERAWNRGISDLYRAAGEEGTFNYNFFKATARAGE